MTPQRRNELLDMLLRKANHRLEDLVDMDLWDVELSKGLVTEEEITETFPMLSTRIQAMILPTQAVINWTDPVDGWQHLAQGEE